MTARCNVLTPIGMMLIEASETGITRAVFTDEPVGEEHNAHTMEAQRQLADYFAGTLRAFDLPLDLRGTPFQMKVWAALTKIPFGETRSYREIAASVGNCNAARAVGMANNKNPAAVIVPCHRIIGANGSLTGYGGGLWRKERLLAREKELAELDVPPVDDVGHPH